MQKSLCEGAAMKVKVLLADDHTLVTQGLEVLLKEKFNLVGTVNDGRALITAADTLKPDVIVTDISMPGLNGLDAVRQVKASRPETRVIILTMHAEPQLAEEAFRLGASGFLIKSGAGEELVRAIQEVSQGRFYITSLIAQDLINVLMEASKKPVSGASSLSGRQREVLQLIAEGRTMKEISSILHISQRTAETHKYEIMRILGVATTADLIRHAMRMKLISA